jgi:hypothetical protein
MNFRLFTIALLISALPALANADSKISLTKEDFVAAQKISREGESIISVKLSKSGKAKMKKLNQVPGIPNIHSDIAGVESDMKLKGPIKGDSLEMGPYSTVDAEKIVIEINKNDIKE